MDGRTGLKGGLSTTVMGIAPHEDVDEALRLRIFVDTDRFMEEIPQYLEREDNLQTFAMSDRCSLVYRRFLSMDLSSYKAIRGQVISPVSLALKIVDENDRPIVYNDEMRALAYSFIHSFRRRSICNAES